MAAVTYSPSAYEQYVIEEVEVGKGSSRTTNQTHLIRYTVTNVHATAFIKGHVEINNVRVYESPVLSPGQSWTQDFGAPGLALGGPNNRVGWGLQEA